MGSVAIFLAKISGMAKQCKKFYRRIKIDTTQNCALRNNGA